MNPDERIGQYALQLRPVPRIDRVLESLLHRTDFNFGGAFRHSRSVFIGDAMRGMGLGRQHAESSTFERTVAIYGDTAIVTSRVRNRFPNDDREAWFNQSRVYVRGSGGWKLAMGQGHRIA